MSKKLQSQSPVTLKWDTKPEDDKENIQRKMTLSELQKKFDKLPIKSLQKNDIDGKTSNKVGSTGAIPKRFGEVTNVPRPKKVLRRQGATLESSAKHQLNGQVYTKTKFAVFDEVIDPLCHSTTVEEHRHAAFKKAKEFFEQAAEGTSEGETKKLKKLNTIEEANSPVKKHPKHQRVKQLITEHAAVDDKVTPHEIPPPEPEKVKVLHKLVSTDQESNKKLRGHVNYRERDFLYLDDFVLYQQDKDQRRKFSPNYRQMNASLEQRQTVVLFIVRVCFHNAYPSHFVYQTVRIFDDMLQAKYIPLKDIQLVMITALWLVMKKDFIVYSLPSASKMASFSDGLYSEVDIIRCEVEILETLKFSLIYPEPISLLCACIWSVKNPDVISQEEMNDIYYCGCYMIDLATIDEELITKSAVLLAVTAAELAMTVVAEHEDSLYCAPFTRWRSQHGWLLVEDHDIFLVRNLFIRNIIESCYRSSRCYTVYKKYCRSRYGKVAAMLIRKIQKLLPPE